MLRLILMASPKKLAMAAGITFAVFAAGLVAVLFPVGGNIPTDHRKVVEEADFNHLYVPPDFVRDEKDGIESFSWEADGASYVYYRYDAGFDRPSEGLSASYTDAEGNSVTDTLVETYTDKGAVRNFHHIVNGVEIK